MGDWLRVHPMVVLLLPVIAAILLCDYLGEPFSLMRDTEFPYIDQNLTYRAILTDYPSPRNKTSALPLRLLSIEQSSTIPIRGKIILYLDSAAQMPSIGDTILIRTRIKRGGVLGDFDYGKYLRRQGIIGTGYASASHYRLLRPSRHLPFTLYPRYIQHYLQRRLASMGFAPRELGTLSAITLGYKEDLAPETKRAFQVSGAAHLLAVSGLHTGIIYAILWNILTLFGYRKPFYQERAKRIALSVVILFSLWAYAHITGFTPSVVRAALMASIAQLGYMTYRSASAFNTVAAAAFFILIFSPRSLFSVSFQLSFAAVIAILAAVKTVRYRNPFTDLLLVSIAAWIGTLPLTLYYFGQCSNYFLLTNSIVILLSWLSVLGGIACLFFGTLPVIGTALIFLTQWTTRLMNSATGWIESLPGSLTRITITPLTAVVLYGAIILFFTGLFLLTKR